MAPLTRSTTQASSTVTKRSPKVVVKINLREKSVLPSIATSLTDQYITSKVFLAFIFLSRN
ncbi:hypothetical protein HOLleu_24929 [Holothuria leucospilota]|uniref:Uncharacterized protein n=1 Tax=Holothuria leucospilota TaxID=206669 RepID=A0A9Q1BRS6_HOLLE|nr:hypothetical protein HOLleu_24929 [Holothuria leucospilota]